MAAAPYYNNVLVTCTTTGTGTLTLGAAVTGGQTFAVIGDGNTTPMAVWEVDANGNPSGAWEVAVGCTYTAAGTTLTRGTLSESSTGSVINFGAGTKRVAQALPAAILNGLVTASQTYIRGCLVTRSSTTAIAVSAGVYWDQTLNKMVTYAGGTNSPTLGASLTYSVFLANGAIEVFQEAPPSTTYAGTARIRASGNGGRFIGWFVTNSSSQIIVFQSNELANGFAYFTLTTPFSAPFRILNAGTNTTYGSITSMAGCVPNYVVSEVLIQIFLNYATTAGAQLGIDISLDATNRNSAFEPWVPSTAAYPTACMWTPVVASTPGVYYLILGTAPGVAGRAYIDVVGFKVTR